MYLTITPYGRSEEGLNRKVWLSMKKYFGNVKFKSLYGGSAYIAASIK